MFSGVGLARAGKITAAVMIVLSLAACAGNKNKLSGPSAGTAGYGTAAPGSVQEFATAVGDRVFFDTDSSELRPDARATLDRQAQWLNQYSQYPITIEGHADERGTREYNIALGARRAQAVREYLSSRGVNPQRMRTISYGKERPVAVCNDISCWSQNRRAVTVLNASS